MIDPRRGRLFRLLGFLLWMPALCVAETAPVAKSSIPEVHTLSFSGDRVDFPQMLQGKVGILILGFTKAARSQVALWGRRLPTDYFYSPEVLYYEMPMLAGVPRLLRGAVLKSIKSEVSVRSQPHFAPLTSDEDRWRTLVHYSQPEDAYVVLVDSHGQIQEQIHGAPTDASYQELKRRVEQLLAVQPR